MTKKRKKEDTTAEDEEYNSVFQKSGKGDHITIKISLKAILKDYDINFPIINGFVIRSHEIVIRTMEFIKLFILYKKSINQMDKLPELNKENVLYFIRACGNASNQGRKVKNVELKDELDKFYTDEFYPLINKEKFDLKNMSYATPYLAINIATAISNNIELHFITRRR